MRIPASGRREKFVMKWTSTYTYLLKQHLSAFGRGVRQEDYGNVVIEMLQVITYIARLCEYWNRIPERPASLILVNVAIPFKRVAMTLTIDNPKPVPVSPEAAIR